MKITYYGHASFGVVVGGKHLLFDPFITPNPLAKSIDVGQINADFIFVSHAHQDHMADVVTIAQRTKAVVVANYELANWFEKQGVPEARPLNPGGTVVFDFGRAKSVNAVHSSSLPNGAYGGVAGGFVIESKEGNFYYSGDTALTQDMKLIGERTRLKFAVLCLGDNFTMGVEDAVLAAQFVGCDQIMGVHYDTFPEIKINHSLAREKFSTQGLTLHLLNIGETHDF